jgi:hypothetical protein
MVYVWRLIVYIQFARWLPAVDLDIPPYIMVLYKELNKVFDYSEFLSSDTGSTLSQTKLEYFGVETTLFTANAEEWLFVSAFLMMGFVVISVLGRRKASFAELKVAATWSLVIRLHIVISMDICVYSLV